MTRLPRTAAKGKITVRRVVSQAGWRVIGDQRCYFRSKMEANYARVLEFQRKQGLIAAWSHEPETFWFKGIQRGCVSYKPDFRIVTNDGDKIFHEVKGYMDAKSRIKLKRMKKYFPKVPVTVIDDPAYKGFKRTCSKLIKDWE